MDVIGTIASCLDLACWVAEQVKKYIEAPQNLRAICDDAQLIQTYLGQLQDAVKPDPKAALTARRLPDGNVKSALDAVHSCQAVLGDIKLLVHNVLQERVGIDGTFTATTGVRLRYRYHETEFDKLRADLKDCELHLVLASSLQTLNLSRQPAQSVMHPLDRKEIDNLTMMVGLVWNAIKETKEPRGPDTSRQPGGDNAVSTWVYPDQNGSKDITSSGHAGTVVKRGNIARVERSWFSQEVLARRGCRWLHDPFDQTMITIYDVTEDELQTLLQESQSEHTDAVPSSAPLLLGDTHQQIEVVSGVENLVPEPGTVVVEEPHDGKPDRRRLPRSSAPKKVAPVSEVVIIEPTLRYSNPESKVSLEDAKDKMEQDHTPSSDTSPAYLDSSQALVDFLLQDTTPSTPAKHTHGNKHGKKR